jgi:hypothetical protein
MTLSMKTGASLRLVQPQAAVMAQIVEGCYAAINVPCVVTAGSDGIHMVGSLHYKGLAMDFRTSNVPEPSRAELVLAIRAALGAEFDVVLETDHIHAEWQPKTPDPAKA